MKNSRKKKNLRARVSDFKENLEDSETLGVSETRLSQKYRNRRTGIDSIRLQSGEIKEGEEEEKPLAPDTLAIPDGKGQWGMGMVEPSVSKSIGVQDTFHKEVNQKDALTSQMENYVEEELEKRRKGEQRLMQEQTKKNEEKKLSEEDQLYQTPDFLKQDSILDEDDVSGERWLAGITEVPLDITFKLRNIEETEMAKQELFSKRGKRKEKEGPLPANSNFNSNFNRHKREFDRKRKQETTAYWEARRSKDAGVPIPLKTDDAPSNSKNNVAGHSSSARKFRGDRGEVRRRSNVPFATDERVLDRFIKRFKWK